jgi:hypothetical protein
VTVGGLVAPSTYRQPQNARQVRPGKVCQFECLILRVQSTKKTAAKKAPAPRKPLRSDLRWRAIVRLNSVGDQVVVPFPLADALVILPPLLALYGGVIGRVIRAQSLLHDFVLLEALQRFTEGGRQESDVAGRSSASDSSYRLPLSPGPGSILFSIPSSSAASMTVRAR